MALKLAIIFAVVAVATASSYSEDDLSQISHQVDLCLRDLPELPGDFTPQIKDTCNTKGFLQLWNGASKEEITPTIVDCVRGYKEVSSAQVTAAEACLKDRLSRPLNQSIDYTAAQQKEILARVSKCLQLVPTYPKGRQPKVVCLSRAASSLEDGIWKEDLEDESVRCLQNHEFTVSADVVAKAKACLREELDADV